MSDDIDIEEHDLLEHPTLKKIFPDLSVIKKEITQYEQGSGLFPEATSLKDFAIEKDSTNVNYLPTVVKPDPNTQTDSQQASVTNRLEVHLRFKRFLDSLDDDSFESTDNGEIPSTCNQDLKYNVASYSVNSLKAVEITERKELKSQSSSVNSLKSVKIPRDLKYNVPFNSVNYIKTVEVPDDKQNNILILGSKPSLGHAKKNFSEGKQFRIVLKNISPYLNSCKQYCKVCLILFPSVDALTLHVRQSHYVQSSNTVAGTKKLLSEKTRVGKFQCKMCSVSVNYKGNLYRHYSRKHKLVKSKIEKIVCNKRNISTSTRINKTRLRPHKPQKEVGADVKNKLTTGTKCFHCTKIFETRNSLIEHLYEVINPTKSVSNSSTKTTKNQARHIDIQMDDQRLTKTTRTSKIHNSHKDIKMGTDNSTKPAKTTKSQDSHKRIEMGDDSSTETANAGNRQNNHNDIEMDDSSTDTANSQISDNDIEMDIDNFVTSKNTQCSICAIHFSTDEMLEKHNKLKHRNCKTKGIHKSSNLKNNHVKKYTGALKLNRFKDIITYGGAKTLKQNKITVQEKNDKNFVLKDCVVSIHKYSDSSNSVTECAKKTDKNTKHTPLNAKKTVEVYQCFVCYRYFTSFGRYTQHMRAWHDVLNVSEKDKTVFKPQCHYCSKNVSMKLYNWHISKSHNNRKGFQGRGFLSILFKCVKCDVFLTSAKAANCHSEHKDLLKWKCYKCRKLFKKKDKAIHLKQHLSTYNDITSYALSESALSRVLYKCLKCGIHFSEQEYFLHDGLCDTDIPNSTYCNICHILVNKNDITRHLLFHEDQNSNQSIDFTIIESDIIYIKFQNQVKDPRFNLTFCHACNCFLSTMGSQHKCHNDGRCAKLLYQKMCTKCGLVFTPRGYLSHMALHHKFQNLNMQSFNFYDFTTELQIRPPLPKITSCQICKVHFVNKKTYRLHECDKVHHKMCNICDTKYTEVAFRLHVNYHTYKLSPTISKNKKPSTDLVRRKPITNTHSNSYAAKNILPSESKTLSTSGKINSTETLYLFTCINCDITVDVYDKVVQHCQDHYDFERKSLTKETDSVAKGVKAFAVSIKFDPFYFRFENDVWIKHIFANISKHQINDILEHSMFRFECRLKMEEMQSGQLLLYKCDICQSHISPNELYSHVAISCIYGKKHKCSICGLCFYSSNHRTFHEKTHEQDALVKSTYKIILYNKREHQQFTKAMLSSINKYILYQCRNCKVIVDMLLRDIHKCRNSEIMKCSYCGLLFYEGDFNYHFNKHVFFNNFNSKHMVLILFGKLVSKRTGRLLPSFKGTIYDFTFYKCTNCELCLKYKNNISTHVCVTKSARFHCPKCCLLFLNTELNDHMQLHENNIELVNEDFNSNIIPFSPSVNLKVVENDHDYLQSNKESLEKSDVNHNPDLLKEINETNDNESSDLPQIINMSCDNENSNTTQILNNIEDNRNSETPPIINNNENGNKDTIQNISKINDNLCLTSIVTIGDTATLDTTQNNKNHKSEKSVKTQITNKTCNTENLNTTQIISKNNGNSDTTQIKSENNKNENLNMIKISDRTCDNEKFNTTQKMRNSNRDEVHTNTAKQTCKPYDNKNLSTTQEIKSTNENAKIQKDNNINSNEIISTKKQSHAVNLDSKEKSKNPRTLENSNKDQNNKKSSDNETPVNTQKIYKCRCGLHFVEEFDAKKHCNACNPKMKISKQRCFKCDLLFTPGELFNHLLKHHDKKIKYTYEIINLPN